MKQKTGRILMFFCMLTLLFLVRHGEIYAAEECTAPKHILFISSYSYSWGSVPWQINDMLKDMLNHPGDKTPAMRYDTPGMYYFDYAVLKKFGLKMSALPEEAEVINLPVSLWRKYSNQIIIGLLLVLLTASLAFSFVISETQRKLRINNEELRKANRAKMDFLSNMSHDMRTPMNAILGLTALLRGRTDPAEIRSDVGQIEKSGRYLLSLINDTLDMSKIEAGKLELHPAPAGRREIAENILMTARILADQKGVHFTAELPPDKSEAWSPVYVDVSRTEQVFINLLSNAVKFTPAGGTVTLRMENMSVSSTEIVDRITVSDTGIGMSQEFQKHLFEPFSQEGRANTSRESGTGLGLAIVKRILDLMDGRITVESECGKGTVITVILHSPRCNVQQLKQKASVQQDFSILKGKHVLICEDHPINAEIAARLLESAGVRTTIAENGKIGADAFAEAPADTFDAILMDVRMPVMDGLEAARTIRALPGRPDAESVPIIAMTANTFEEDVRRCMDAGMNRHLSKPIDPAELFQALAEAISTSQKIFAQS